jgi:hypothetical protein
MPSGRSGSPGDEAVDVPASSTCWADSFANMPARAIHESATAALPAASARGGQDLPLLGERRYTESVLASRSGRRRVLCGALTLKSHNKHLPRRITA